MKKVRLPKYNIGDKLLIRGSELDHERVLSVKAIDIRIKKRFGDEITDIWYSFNESIWSHVEEDVIKRVDI